MRRAIVILGAILALAALDLLTKSWAFARVPFHWSEHLVIIDGFFYITHAENDGAMWSLFQGLPAVFWVILRGGVFLLILWQSLKAHAAPRWVQAALVLVLAGALGNLYDNMTGNGRVRDFVTWVFWGWPFPTFNLADSYISVGAVLLGIWFLWAEPRQRKLAQA
jgi:signal peptidase II